MATITIDSPIKELAETREERRLLSFYGTTGIGAGAVVEDGEDGAVPVIDLAQPESKVEDQLWEAANNVGFFTVINHGISQELIDNAFTTSAEYFAQPVVDKKEQSPFDRALNCGFEYKEQVRPSSGTPDQKESLHINVRKGCMDRRWPTTPSGLRDLAEQSMVPEAHRLAMRIMGLLERRACNHLKPGTLENAHTLWEEDSRSCLRLLHYPPMSAENRTELLKPGNMHWRASPHTDFSCITLLFQRMGEGGLECRANPRSAVGSTADANWLPVNPVEGGIAVNIGDMLSRWSDGNLYANLHRVRMPRDDECDKSRYSIAYFAQADSSYLIESVSNEPITAEDYIKMRLQSNFKK